MHHTKAVKAAVRNGDRNVDDFIIMFILLTGGLIILLFCSPARSSASAFGSGRVYTTNDGPNPVSPLVLSTCGPSDPAMRQPGMGRSLGGMPVHLLCTHAEFETCHETKLAPCQARQVVRKEHPYRIGKPELEIRLSSSFRKIDSRMPEA